MTSTTAKTGATSFSLVLTALFAAIIIIMAFTPLGYIPLVVINATIIHIPVILGAIFCGPKKGAFLGFIFGLTSFIKNTLMPTSLSAFVFSPVLAYQMVGVSGIIKSTIICFVPRILVGVIPYFVFLGIQKLIEKTDKNTAKSVSVGILAAIIIVSLHALFAGLLTGDNGGKIAWVLAVVIAFLICVGLTGVMKGRSAAHISYAYAGLAGALTNTLLVMPGIYIFYRDAYAKALSIEPDAVIGVIQGVISFNGMIEAVVAAILVAAIGIILERLPQNK
ncbi:MAG: ECF transporter S component [Lachnospiraceae bacterium]|nr:ECF transporter S component [Lachnospiraceae bacterium]